MGTPTNVVRVRHREDLDDPLTEVLRSGARHLDARLPVLYLRGVSTGDFQEALAALSGA